MSGVLTAFIVGKSASLSYSGTVTVGTSTIGGKGFSATQHGYGDSTVALQGVTFGSRSPTTTSGFTILGIYWEQTVTTTPPSNVVSTTLIVSGDSSAYGASMLIGGVDQGLNSGNFSGGVTTYSNIGTTNPFGGDGSTIAVTIS